jgi:importin subunit beta-1
MLLESINDTPNVAEKVCGVIYLLAQGYEDNFGVPSSLLPFFQNQYQALLATTNREDVKQFTTFDVGL